MNSEERKAWEKEHLRIKEALPRLPDGWLKDVYKANLAADAELKSCHEIMEREGKELIHLRIVVASQVDMTKLFKERWELEQIRYEGISSANEELRARVAVLEGVVEAADNLRNADVIGERVLGELYAALDALKER